jgi:H+-translocating NAD(P) transhydrogenase subunit beta
MEFMMAHILEIIYFIASISFIIGLKMLSHPLNARKGNLLAAGGMTLAILATMFLYEHEGKSMGNHIWIITGIGVGTIIGVLMAKKVKMTAMPQMVSFFNGMGGACAAVIGLVEYVHYVQPEGDTNLMSGSVFTMLAGLIIGSVSFSGSMVAYGKLEGKIGDKSLPGSTWINILLMVGLLVMMVYMMLQGEINPALAYGLLALALIYGITFVMPIGGADMPVVISLLNSFTGVAAAFGGFLYDNQAMLTGGILVGSAGTILTILMCKAMNRSLFNVIVGSFGGSASATAGGASGDQVVREISVSDLAVQLKYCQRVRVVPGYGLAVAQAQHLCHELEKFLESEGVDVKFSIHPVAGRMPGHMNVLLAEADVPYEKLQEMEDANEEMDRTDVVLVIGANDVVNPAAKNDTSSPIYGMPILEVDRAKMTVILKRSMGAGYAGIENELFFYDKSRMLFGDAKQSLQNILQELKSL